MRPRAIAPRGPKKQPPRCTKYCMKKYTAIFTGNPGKAVGTAARLYVTAVRRNGPGIRTKPGRRRRRQLPPRGPPAPHHHLFLVPHRIAVSFLVPCPELSHVVLAPRAELPVPCRCFFPPSGPGGGAKPGVHRRRSCSRPRLENDRDGSHRRSRGVEGTRSS